MRECANTTCQNAAGECLDGFCDSCCSCPRYSGFDLASLRAENERLKADYAGFREDLAESLAIASDLSNEEMLGTASELESELSGALVKLTALRVAHEVACCERDQARMERDLAGAERDEARALVRRYFHCGDGVEFEEVDIDAEQALHRWDPNEPGTG